MTDEHGAENIVSFFEGKTFKAICAVLIVIAIGYTLLSTGSIPTSRVPQYQRTDYDFSKSKTRPNSRNNYSHTSAGKRSAAQARSRQGNNR